MKQVGKKGRVTFAGAAEGRSCRSQVIIAEPDGWPDQDGKAEIERRCKRARGRAALVMIGLMMAFGLLGGQLVRLGLKKSAMPEGAPRIAFNRPIERSYARPDIVDRAGLLLATDLVGHSLYADPSRILDVDRVVEALVGMFPDLDALKLRKKLSDRRRQFEWIKRGLTPRLAQRAHDLGLPGLGLRKEPKRTYPLGRLAGHLIGAVSVDNVGISGVERFVDQRIGIEAVVLGTGGTRERLRLTIDVGVQHGLEEELAAAMARYRARGAGGVVLDAATGEVVALASLPDVAPAFPMEAREAQRIDRMTVGRYELGSVFKAMTLALALDRGAVTARTMIDVTGPLDVNGHEIKDLHPAGRRLAVREVFLRSSNVGFGRIGLGLGAAALQDFYARAGLGMQGKTEAGLLARPRMAKVWREAETATAAFGHGIAVAPLQFAVAAAALVNGGWRVEPTVVVRSGGREERQKVRVMSAATSATMRRLLRDNVVSKIGTGRRADVAGYEVGGKTGTAEQAVGGRYKKKTVISSFLAAFPMRAPRYIVYVLLFEPQPVAASKGKITAGLTAAPLAGRVIQRVAPLLGVLPRM